MGTTKMRGLLMLGAMLGFWTCQKGDIPIGPSEDPVFMVNYRIDNLIFNQVAGIQGVYLFTNSALDKDEVWEFSGSFASDTCRTADCPGTLRFIWRNNAAANDFSTTWRLGLFPMYYASNSDSTRFGTYLSFLAGSSAAQEPIWTLDNSQDLIAQQVYFVGQNGPLQTKVSAVHQAGYRSSLDQQFFPLENQFCVQAALEAQIDTPFVQLKVIPLTPGSYEYHWFNDSSALETQANWVVDEEYAVTITDIAQGCSAVLSLGNLPPSRAQIQTGMVLGESKGTVPAQTGGPVIEWIDEEGNAWRSDRKPQLYSQGQFYVLDISDYLSNENGQPTMLMQVSWFCQLYNAAGDTRFCNGSGIIAVAWPG
ncbi:MAG: hypothetical protein IT260_07640 [Saprospiraceae bacterium]|nr:hypothetical protein [Saprospiraceae bacterium]